MTILNDRLSFNLGTIQKQDVRTRPSKYAQSNLRNWRFEQSEGIRPAEYFGVYKYLPVQFQDVNTEDWVVIPKGRIVSSYTGSESNASGLIPQNSGWINIGNSGDYMGTGTGANIQVNVNTSFFGYDEHICGLLIPANGGSGTVNMYYSADDVTAGTKTNVLAGTAATASGAVAFAANMPIGVAFNDIYQDINGKYLNYRMHEDGYHILTDWYVEVPFVDNRSTGDASGFALPTNANVNTFGRWRNLNKQFTYLSFDSTSTSYSAKPGAFVCPDILGNYTLQSGTTTALLTGTNANVSGTLTPVTQVIKTCQTVGKLLALDSRFPKDSLEEVLTYPRSGMPGSQTGGIIKNLFDFVYYTLYIASPTGTAPTIEQIYNGIRSGVFGLARIQLHVS
jgi:hypothetical protein